MTALMHMVDRESMDGAAVEGQGVLEGTPMVAAERQSSSEFFGVDRDETVINGDNNIPNLNVHTDSEELMDVSTTVMPTQQILLVQEGGG